MNNFLGESTMNKHYVTALLICAFIFSGSCTPGSFLSAPAEPSSVATDKKAAVRTSSTVSTARRASDDAISSEEQPLSSEEIAILKALLLGLNQIAPEHASQQYLLAADASRTSLEIAASIKESLQEDSFKIALLKQQVNDNPKTIPTCFSTLIDIVVDEKLCTRRKIFVLYQAIDALKKHYKDLLSSWGMIDSTPIDLIKKEALARSFAITKEVVKCSIAIIRDTRFNKKTSLMTTDVWFGGRLVSTLKDFYDHILPDVFFDDVHKAHANWYAPSSSINLSPE